jgi:hydroxymethylpyrimidine pyrophosphatase-like HAD family hydrolase
MAALRCAYIDLDGTLLGRGASLVHDGDGHPSLLGVRAVEACLRAEVEIVLVSGRRAAQMAEDSRLLGQRAYVFEAGAGLVVDGDTYWSTGEFDPEQERTIHDQIEDTGAPALLLERYAGQLEYHDPYHRNRQVSHLFRGLVDAGEANALVARHGLRLLDNGTAHRRSAALADLPQIRVYHLVPHDTAKVNGVARHMRMRGYEPQETIAIGDSPEDLRMHEVTGTFWLVANALDRDPALGPQVGRTPNARIAESGHGAGVYEAIVTTLAQQRG